MSNVGRAEAALDEVRAFAKKMGQTDEEAETVMGDMIADLMHLCRLALRRQGFAE